MADLLTSVRDYLIEKDLGRDPRVAPSDPVGNAHPIWRDPRDGAIAPGEAPGDENDPDLVISIYRPGGVPQGYFEDAVWRKDTVDFFLRGRTSKVIFDYEPELRRAFVREDSAPVPRTNWTMAGLPVIESSLWRPLQTVDRGEQGYTYLISFLFETYLD